MSRVNIPTQTEVFAKHPQRKTQLVQIKEHLLKYGKITTWDAFTKYHITRLSQYIMMLRKEGFEIDMEWATNNKKRYGIYTLKQD
jgi:hypothetical protein